MADAYAACDVVVLPVDLGGVRQPDRRVGRPPPAAGRRPLPGRPGAGRLRLPVVRRRRPPLAGRLARPTPTRRPRPEPWPSPETTSRWPTCQAGWPGCSGSLVVDGTSGPDRTCPDRRTVRRRRPTGAAADGRRATAAALRGGPRALRRPRLPGHHHGRHRRGGRGDQAAPLPALLVQARPLPGAGRLGRPRTAGRDRRGHRVRRGAPPAGRAGLRRLLPHGRHPRGRVPPPLRPRRRRRRGAGRRPAPGRGRHRRGHRSADRRRPRPRAPAVPGLRRGRHGRGRQPPLDGRPGRAGRGRTAASTRPPPTPRPSGWPADWPTWPGPGCAPSTPTDRRPKTRAM